MVLVSTLRGAFAHEALVLRGQMKDATTFAILLYLN